MRANAPLLTGPVTTPQNSPDAQPAAARSIAAQATRAPSPEGTPGVAENSARPTAIFSAGVVSVASQVAGPSTATSPASSPCAVSQAAMISGPTPAGSPQVKANLLGIVVLRTGRPTCPGKAALAAGEKLEESSRLSAEIRPCRELPCGHLADIAHREIDGGKRRL